MKNFLSFSEKELYESSLSRIWSHAQDRTFGMLTAFRGEFSLKENLQRNKKLEASIRSNGFGFVKAIGHYNEGKGTDSAIHVVEETFIVISGKEEQSTPLKNFLIKNGKEFSQDSVFYKDKGRPDGVLIGTKQGVFPGLGIEVSVGKFNPNKIGEYYTQLKNYKNRTFMFESIVFPKNGHTMAYEKKNKIIGE